MSASHPDPFVQQVEMDEGIDLSADVVEVPLKAPTESADTTPAPEAVQAEVPTKGEESATPEEEHSSTEATPSSDAVASDVGSTESPAPADLAAENQPTDLEPVANVDTISQVAPFEEVQEATPAHEPLATDEVAPLSPAAEAISTPSQDQSEPTGRAQTDSIAITTPVQPNEAVAPATDASSEELPSKLPTAADEPETTPAPNASEAIDNDVSKPDADATTDQAAAESAPVVEEAPVAKSAAPLDIMPTEDPIQPLNTNAAATPPSPVEANEAASMDAPVEVNDAAVEAAPTTDDLELAPADANPPQSQPSDGEIAQLGAAEVAQEPNDSAVSADAPIVAEPMAADSFATASDPVEVMHVVEPGAAVMEAAEDEADAVVADALKTPVDAEIPPEAHVPSESAEEPSEVPVEGEMLGIDDSAKSAVIEPEAEVTVENSAEQVDDAMVADIPSVVEQTEAVVEVESFSAAPETVNEDPSLPDSAITEALETTEHLVEGAIESSISETPVVVPEEQAVGGLPAESDAAEPEAPVEANDLIQSGADGTSAVEATDEPALELPATDITEAVAAPLVESEPMLLVDDVPADIAAAHELCETTAVDAPADQTPDTHNDKAVVAEDQPQPASVEPVSSADAEPIVDQADAETAQTDAMAVTIPEAPETATKVSAEVESTAAEVDSQTVSPAADSSLDVPESTEATVAPMPVEAASEAAEPIGDADVTTEPEPFVSPGEVCTTEVETVMAATVLAPMAVADLAAPAEPETLQDDEASVLGASCEGEPLAATDEATTEPSATAAEPVEDDAPVCVATPKPAEKAEGVVEQAAVADEQLLDSREAAAGPADGITEPEATPEDAVAGADTCDAVSHLENAADTSATLAEAVPAEAPADDAVEVTNDTHALGEPIEVGAEVAQTTAPVAEVTGLAVQEASEEVSTSEPSATKAAIEVQSPPDLNDAPAEVDKSALANAVDDGAPEAMSAGGQDHGVEIITPSDACPLTAIPEPTSSEIETVATQPADVVESEVFGDEPSPVDNAAKDAPPALDGSVDITTESELAPTEGLAKGPETLMQVEPSPSDQAAEPEMVPTETEGASAVVEAEAETVERETPLSVVEKDTPTSVDEATVPDAVVQESALGDAHDSEAANEESAPVAAETVHESVIDADAPAAEVGLEAYVPALDEPTSHETEVIQSLEIDGQASTDAGVVAEEATTQEQAGSQVPCELVELKANADALAGQATDAEPSTIAAIEVPDEASAESAGDVELLAANLTLALDEAETVEEPATTTEASQGEAVPGEGEVDTTEATEPSVKVDTGVSEADKVTDSTKTVETSDDPASVEDHDLEFRSEVPATEKFASVPELAAQVNKPTVIALDEAEVEVTTKAELNTATEEAQLEIKVLPDPIPENLDDSSVAIPLATRDESGESMIKTSPRSLAEDPVEATDAAIPEPSTEDTPVDTEAVPVNHPVEATDAAIPEPSAEDTPVDTEAVPVDDPVEATDAAIPEPSAEDTPVDTEVVSAEDPVEATDAAIPEPSAEDTPVDTEAVPVDDPVEATDAAIPEPSAEDTPVDTEAVPVDDPVEATDAAIPEPSTEDTPVDTEVVSAEDPVEATDAAIPEPSAEDTPVDTEAVPVDDPVEATDAAIPEPSTEDTPVDTEVVSAEDPVEATDAAIPEPSAEDTPVDTEVVSAEDPVEATDAAIPEPSTEDTPVDTEAVPVDDPVEATDAAIPEPSTEDTPVDTEAVPVNHPVEATDAAIPEPSAEDTPVDTEAVPAEDPVELAVEDTPMDSETSPDLTNEPTASAVEGDESVPNPDVDKSSPQANEDLAGDPVELAVEPEPTPMTAEISSEEHATAPLESETADMAQVDTEDPSSPVIPEAHVVEDASADDAVKQSDPPVSVSASFAEDTNEAVSEETEDVEAVSDYAALTEQATDQPESTTPETGEAAPEGSTSAGLDEVSRSMEAEVVTFIDATTPEHSETTVQDFVVPDITDAGEIVGIDNAIEESSEPAVEPSTVTDDTESPAKTVTVEQEASVEATEAEETHLSATPADDVGTAAVMPEADAETETSPQAEDTLDQNAPATADSTECTEAPAAIQVEEASTEIAEAEMTADLSVDTPATERAIDLAATEENDGDVAPVDESIGAPDQAVAEEEDAASGQEMLAPETAEDPQPVVEESVAEPVQPKDLLTATESNMDVTEEAVEPVARLDVPTVTEGEGVVDNEPESTAEASPKPIEVAQLEAENDPSFAADALTAVEPAETETASADMAPVESTTETQEIDRLATEAEPIDGGPEHPVAEDATPLACDAATAEEPAPETLALAEVEAEPLAEPESELTVPIVAEAIVVDEMALTSEASQAPEIEIVQSAEPEAICTVEPQEQQSKEASPDTVAATKESTDPEIDEVVPEQGVEEHEAIIEDASAEQLHGQTKTVTEAPMETDAIAAEPAAAAEAEADSAEPVVQESNPSSLEPAVADSEAPVVCVVEENTGAEVQPEAAVEPELADVQTETPAEVEALAAGELEASSPVEPQLETSDTIPKVLDSANMVADEQTRPEAQPELEAVDAEVEALSTPAEALPTADPVAGETTCTLELTEQPEEVQDDTEAQSNNFPSPDAETQPSQVQVTEPEQTDETASMTEAQTPPVEVAETAADVMASTEFAAPAVSDDTAESPEAPGADERLDTASLEPTAEGSEAQIEPETAIDAAPLVTDVVEQPAEGLTPADPETETEVTATPAETPLAASAGPAMADIQPAADKEPVEPLAAVEPEATFMVKAAKTVEVTVADSEVHAGQEQIEEAILNAAPIECSEDLTQAQEEMPVAPSFAKPETEVAADPAEELVAKEAPIEDMERSADSEPITPELEPEAAAEPVVVDHANDQVPQPDEPIASVSDAPTATEAAPEDMLVPESAAASEEYATALDAPGSDDGVPQSTADTDVEPATVLAAEPQADTLSGQEPVVDVAETSAPAIDETTEVVVDDEPATEPIAEPTEVVMPAKSSEELIESSAETSADTEPSEPITEDSSAGEISADEPTATEASSAPMVAEDDVVVTEVPSSEEAAPSEQIDEQVAESVGTDDAPLADAPVEESSPVDREVAVPCEQAQAVATEVPEDATAPAAANEALTVCPGLFEAAEAPVATEVPAVTKDTTPESVDEPMECPKDAHVSNTVDLGDVKTEAAADVAASEPAEVSAATDDSAEQVMDAVEDDAASIHSIPAAEDDVDSVIEEPTPQDALPERSTGTRDVADPTEVEATAVSPTPDILDSSSSKAVEAMATDGPTGDKQLSETESAVYESASEALATDSAIAGVTKPQDETPAEESEPKPESKPKRVHRSMWRRLKSWFVYTPE